MMARPQQETIDQLTTLFRLPFETDGADGRPASLASEVRRISEEFGWLVFEDLTWFEYDPSRISDILDAWLDVETADWLDALFRDQETPEIVDRFAELVARWKGGELSAAGPALEGAPQYLGIENPHFRPNEVPGTEFYRYRNDEYVYAATADAPDDEWKTLEERYDEARRAASSDEGLLRGYPYTSSVLPGTEYYRLEGSEYLYGPHETGPADMWQPYEYWQHIAEGQQNENLLVEHIDSFIALIDHHIGTLA